MRQDTQDIQGTQASSRPAVLRAVAQPDGVWFLAAHVRVLVLVLVLALVGLVLVLILSCPVLVSCLSCLKGGPVWSG